MASVNAPVLGSMQVHSSVMYICCSICSSLLINSQNWLLLTVGIYSSVLPDDGSRLGQGPLEVLLPFYLEKPSIKSGTLNKQSYTLSGLFSDLGTYSQRWSCSIHPFSASTNVSKKKLFIVETLCSIKGLLPTTPKTFTLKI